MVKEKQRNFSLDILRIISAMCVVLLHTSAYYWYISPIGERDWIISGVYDVFSRFAVPVFVMISGALFLSGDEKPNIRRIVIHNFLRILIIFLLWSCIYGLINSFSVGIANIGVKQILKMCLAGKYHLWFLPMIGGIYLVSPLLYVMVNGAGEKMLRYYMMVFFCLQIIRSTLITVINNPELVGVLEMWNIPMVCTYISYFILGYYLVRYGISSKCWLLIKIIALPAFILNASAVIYLSKRNGGPDIEFANSFGIGTFIIAIFIFVGINKIVMKLQLRGFIGKVLTNVSKDTLGVYLLHLAVLEIAVPELCKYVNIPTVIAIPLYTIGIFVVCILIIALLRRIPKVGRYIC